MGSITKVLATCALMVGSVAAAPANEVRARQSSLTVSLDYATYQGVQNSDTGLNVWKGIRYAAAPIGNLRWKAPQSPPVTSGVINATDFGSTCSQSLPSVPGAPFIPGNEDCLFLNVYAPPTSGSTKLPVLVWIHGGGYGYDSGKQDLSTIINANNKGFIGVAINYRLGAFGFLSSSEVKANGSPNAGILDMKFALEWVQKNIAKFGGDASHVTITGESAGGGAVMLLGIAKGGKLGTSLFLNGIAQSPYLPAQYDYNGTTPTRLYYEFAAAVGCGSSGSVLDCLRSKDTDTLQQANYQISTSQTYGTWAYLPVTDYDLIPSLTSKALSSGKLNGKNMLVGQNANEGALFVPAGPDTSEFTRSIQTLDDLKAWLHKEFPTFSDADIQKVLDANPASDAPVDPNAPKYETNGLTGATAVDVSQVATGHQQRANNIYAEATFICPSYWLGDAYANKGKSYHYQYSVPFAGHGADVSGYFGPSTPNQSPEFSLAFRQIWGNFVKNTNPSINYEPAAARFPLWEVASRYMLNLNETGGVPYSENGATQFMNPGLLNDFKKVDAYTWEGGRGKRCDFWKTMAPKIPI